MTQYPGAHRKGATLALGGLTVALVISACGPQAAPATPTPTTPTPIAVAAANVARGDIQQTLTFSGEVRARQQISVMPKASGRVEQLLVDTGAQVKGGDTIAVLDQDNPRMQVLQARAALAQAQAHLTTLAAGARPEDVDAARAGLAQQQTKLDDMRHGGRAEDIRSAQDGVAAAQAKLQSLLNGADDAARQSAQSALDADKDALASAQAAYAALGAQNESTLQSGKSQIESLQAQMTSAQAQIDAADAAIANLNGSSAADVQAAQSAYDQAVSQLTTAQAALKQNYNPTQAAISQATADLEAARGQRAQAQAQQTALEQKAGGTCADLPGAPHNATACNSAKAAASSGVSAAEAAVAAAQGQLDLLKRGGSSAQQTQLQAAADQAQAQLNSTKARLDAITNGGVAAARAQATAQKQQARAQLAQLTDSLNAAQASFAALQKGNLDAQVKSAQAQVTAAGEHLKTDQARLDVLLRGATDEDIQQAQAGLDHAQQDLAKAQQPYTPAEVRQQELAAAAADAQLRKAQRPYTDNDLGAAQAAVDGAEAQLETAELGLGETTIIAPVDGTVSERQAAPGALVNPQTPIVTLVPPSLEVLVNVDEAHLGQLASGQSVRFGVATYPDKTFRGQVAEISPTLDTRTRTSTVHIQPKDPDAQLRAGMFAQLNIITASHQGALLVPSAAILNDGPQPQVLGIDSGNVVNLQPVRIGLRTDDVVEVVSGLQEGALIATSNLTTLHAGDVVTPRLADQSAVAQLATNPQ
jgi:HlyD family secretion protein